MKENWRRIEKIIAYKILLYVSGIIIGLVLQVVAVKWHFKPMAGWGFLTLISLWLFAQSKMSSPITPLSMVWCMVSILICSPLPAWAVVMAGAGVFILIDPLFKKPNIENQDMPPTSTNPISKDRFFKYADQGLRDGRIFIGEKADSNTPLWILHSSLVEHMQIVGITRCGKSHFQNSIAYQGMIRKWSVIYITGKPSALDWDIFWYLANHSGRAKEVGYFDPLDDNSGTLNPIAPVGSGGTELEVALQILRAIGREPPAIQERSDAFYKSADFSRLLDLSSVLVNLGRAFTLKDCYQFFSDSIVRERVFNEAMKKGLVDIVTRMKNTYNSIQNKRFDALEGITSQMRPWIAEPVNSKVNDPNPSINIVKLLKEGGILYCALSPARLHSQANALGRQITAQIFAASEMLGSRHIERPPILLILDEFQEYLAPFFSTLISQAGGRDVCIVLAHQDFSQLQRVEGIDKRAFSSNIINNTATKIFFSTRSAEDAENMSTIIGTRKVMKRSRNISIDSGGDIGHRSISEREGEEFIVHPNWFKTPKKFLASVSSHAANNVVRTAVFDVKGLKLPPIKVETKVELNKPSSKTSLQPKPEAKKAAKEEKKSEGDQKDQANNSDTLKGIRWDPNQGGPKQST